MRRDDPVFSPYSLRFTPHDLYGQSPPLSPFHKEERDWLFRWALAGIPPHSLFRHFDSTFLLGLLLTATRYHPVCLSEGGLLLNLIPLPLH